MAEEKIKSAPEKKPKQKRKMSRFRKFLLVFTLLFLGLIAGILLNINRLLENVFIHDFIFKLINKSFFGRIYAGPVKAHILLFDAEGWEVSAEDKDHRLIGRAPYVRVHFNPLSFFWREVRLEKMEIKDPEFHLWTDTDHVFIWKKFKKPPKKKNPIFRVRAGYVEATNGTFSYDYYPEPKPVHVFLTGINANAQFTDKTPLIRGTIEKLYLNYGSFDNWFDNLTVEGLIGDEFTDVKKITATYLNMPMEVSGRIDGFNSKNPRLNINIKLEGKIGDLLRHFKYEKMPPGDFKMTGYVSGRSDDFNITGGFESPWGVVEGQRYDDFTASYIYHKNVIRVTHFSVKWYGMRWDGIGWYNIETGEFSFSGLMFRKGRAVKFAFEGKLDNVTDVMTFTRADFDTPWASLSGSGNWIVNKGTLDLNYKLIIRDLAREMPNWGVRDFAGKMELAGKFTGPIRNPLVTARGKVARLSWKRVMFGDGPLDGVLRNGDLSASLATSNEAARFNGTVTVPILRNGNWANLKRVPLSFKAEAQNIVITKEITGTDFTGVLDGDIEGGGTTVALSATGHSTMRKVKAWGQTIETVTADIEMDQRGITFANMRVTLPGGDYATGTIWADWNFNYDLALESDMMRLSSLDKMKTSDIPVTGTVKFKAWGKGNFGKVHLEADADFMSLKYDTLDLEGGKLHIVLDGTVADMDGSFYQGLGILGAYDFSDGTFHNFHVLFNGMPLKPIFVYKGIEDASGNVSGDMAMEGGAKGWGDVDYRMRLTVLKLILSGEEITAEGISQIEYGPHGGREEIHLKVRGGNLDIMGTISPQKVFALDLTGEFDISLLTVLTTRIRRSSGMASLDAHLDGPSNNVRLSGYMALADASMKFRGYQAEFNNVYGKLIFLPDKIKIEQLAGLIDDEGDFVLDGDVFYKGFKPVGYDLAFLATGLPYSKTGEYKFVLAPDLTLKGSEKAAILRGSVEISEGRYIKDFRIEKSVVEMKRETAPRKPPPAFLKNLKLNVALKGDGNFRVHNNLGDVYFRIDLLVGGTPLSPTVDGSVEGTEGKIFYGGTAFELVRAKVDFIDRDTIDPEVDVFATTEIRDYEIRLYLKGLLSHMQLILESAPPLDGQNILSLLTFGRLTDELTQSQAQIIFNMPIMFDQFLGGIASRNIEKYTGFDVKLAENPSGGQGSRVEVSVPLSKRITFIYLADTGGVEPLRQTRAVYKLTDYLMIEGSQNNFGIYSFKLKVHFETE